jgi:predicted enzyme related to lactoylglutathione lyase
MIMLGSAPAAATIAVKDINAAKNFYGKTLGLRVAQDLGSEACVVEAGQGSMVLLYQRPNHQPSAATVLSFQVDDMDSEMADLKGRGVKFEDYDMPGLKTKNQIATMPDGSKAAWFTDPDGNIISLGEMM